MFTAQSHTGTRRWIYLFAPILCALVILALSTGEASAATKKPAKVSLTGVSSADYNAIKITWKKANAAEKYQVYRASSKNGKYKKVATTASRTYINRKLKFGKKYYYKVRALNKSKKGSLQPKGSCHSEAKKSERDNRVVRKNRKRNAFLEKGQRRNRISGLSGDRQKRIFQEGKITGFCSLHTIRAFERENLLLQDSCIQKGEEIQ